MAAVSSQTIITTEKRGGLPIALYVVAAITLVFSLFGVGYGISFQQGAQASTMFIQSALGPIASQIISLLVNGFQTVILAFSVILFIAAVLLYCAGRNLARSKKLAGRLSGVEVRLSVLEAQAGGIGNETRP